MNHRPNSLKLPDFVEKRKKIFMTSNSTDLSQEAITMFD